MKTLRARSWTLIWPIWVGLVWAFVVTRTAAAQGNTDPVSAMPLLDQWTLVGAILLPLAIGWIIKRGWTTQQQTAVQVVLCTLWGLLGAYIDGAFAGFALDTPDNVIAAVLGSILVTWAWYQTVYKMIPVPQWIEAKTGGDPLVSEAPLRNVA